MKKMLIVILLLQVSLLADFSFSDMMSAMKSAVVDENKNINQKVDGSNIKDTQIVEVTFGVLDKGSEDTNYIYDSGSLGFECESENEIILKMSNDVERTIFEYDVNEKKCQTDANISALTWLPVSMVINTNSYNISVIEKDLVSNDKYEGEPIIFTQEELSVIKSGEYVQKDIGSNYYVGFKGITSHVLETECIEDHNKFIQKYLSLIKERYMNVNQGVEERILSTYVKLKKKGINKDLSKSFDPKYYKKLINAPAEIAYMNIIMRGLKNVKRGLKENNPEDLNMYIKQTKYLMYGWVLPYEILATGNIVNESLLGEAVDFYARERKIIYNGYSRFVRSLLAKELEVGLFEDTLNKDISDSMLNHKGYNGVCGMLNPENISALNKKIKSLILDKNTNPDISVIFNLSVEDLSEENLIIKPLSEEWYLMIRIYMKLQNKFYEMKKEVGKIISILEILPDTEILVADLQLELDTVDSLYRKLDEVVRYNVIDLPISIYADLYYIVFQEGKKWYNDDEKVMSDIAVAYNKSCANMQKYMVSEFAISKVMRITKALKSEFDEETEWKEIKTRAKLTQDWFNMLNKIQIKNK